MLCAKAPLALDKFKPGKYLVVQCKADLRLEPSSLSLGSFELLLEQTLPPKQWKLICNSVWKFLDSFWGVWVWKMCGSKTAFVFSKSAIRGSSLWATFLVLNDDWVKQACSFLHLSILPALLQLVFEPLVSAQTGFLIGARQPSGLNLRSLI